MPLTPHPTWLHSAAGEAEALFERLYLLSLDARRAGEQDDIDAVLDALDAREQVIERVQPLLDSLAAARPHGGLDELHETLLSGVHTLAERLSEADAQLTLLLEAGRTRLGHEIGRLERPAAAHPYRGAGAPLLNLVG